MDSEMLAEGYPFEAMYLGGQPGVSIWETLQCPQ
jgi:hypothetical protein